MAHCPESNNLDQDTAIILLHRNSYSKYWTMGSLSLSAEELKLHRAVRLNDVDETRRILKSSSVSADCAEPKNSWGPVHYAAGNGFLEVLQVLHQDGHVNVNAKAKGGYTALHYAAMQGFLTIVEFLVKETDVDVNAVDKDRFTALHHAARSGYLEIVRFLASISNVDVKALEKDGLTAFDIAVCYSKTEVIAFLETFQKAAEPVKLDKTPKKISGMESG